MEHNSLWNWLARAVTASVHYIIQRINKRLKLLIHILISYAPYIVLSGKKDNFLICKIRWWSFCLTLFEKFNLSFIQKLVLYMHTLQCLIILAFFLFYSSVAAAGFSGSGSIFKAHRVTFQTKDERRNKWALSSRYSIAASLHEYASTLSLTS